MDALLDSSYKARIEALGEMDDFEALGDAEFLEHPDHEARLLWAFYRPSGSHPKQVGDENVTVAVMAFNQSRLQPLERFSCLNPRVVEEPLLRVKIQNRARMLFRAMADNTLEEMIAVLRRYPVYMETACDQIKNGRKYDNSPSDAKTLSELMALMGETLDVEAVAALFTKLKRPESKEDVREIIRELEARRTDARIIRFYLDTISDWLASSDLHPLQKSVIQKEVKKLEKYLTESD